MKEFPEGTCVRIASENSSRNPERELMEKRVPGESLEESLEKTPGGSLRWNSWRNPKNELLEKYQKNFWRNLRRNY